jgi:hypothetical protein
MEPALIGLAATLFAVVAGTIAQVLTRQVDRETKRAREEFTVAVGEPREEARDDPAERDYALLRDYHAQGLGQSKVSFRISVAFASFGFLVIVAAIGRALLVDTEESISQQGAAFITLLSGAVVEAVAALFFVQANRSRILMAEFFDKLRSDRRLQDSRLVADKLADEILRSRLQTLLALNLAEVTTTDELLQALFAENAQPRRAPAPEPVLDEPSPPT